MKDAFVENTKFNKISKSTNIILNLIMAFFAFLSIIPFVFVIIISITDKNILRNTGYSFFPKKLSLEGYKFVLFASNQLANSYMITIIVTVLGTLIGLFIMATYAYALSRKDFAYRKFFNILAFIPMLFGGGLVPFYLVMTQMLHLKNTIWALILPCAVNTFYIMVLRTFFRTSVPESIIESAKIDGASELRIFFQIILPISLPGIATIALFLTLGYWNDWFNAMLFIDEKSLMPLQYLLIRIENSLEFFTQNASKLGINQIEAANNLPKDSARMAMVVLSTLPIIFAYPFFQKYFVNGLTIGAVKE